MVSTVSAERGMHAAFNIMCPNATPRIIWLEFFSPDWGTSLAMNLVAKDKPRISGIENMTHCYICDQHTTKGRFADILGCQPNSINDENGTMWTVFTNGPYIDM